MKEVRFTSVSLSQQQFGNSSEGTVHWKSPPPSAPRMQLSHRTQYTVFNQTKTKQESKHPKCSPSSNAAAQGEERALCRTGFKAHRIATLQKATPWTFSFRMHLTTEHFPGKETETVECRREEKTVLSSARSLQKYWKISITHRPTAPLRGSRGWGAKIHVTIPVACERLFWITEKLLKY